MSFTKHNSLVDVQYKNMFDQSSKHISQSYLSHPYFKFFQIKYDREIFIRYIRVTHAVSFFLRLLIFNLQLLPQNPQFHTIVFVAKHTICWMKNWTHALYHYFSFFVAIHRGRDSIIVPASLRHSRHSTYAYFAQTSRTQSRKSPDTL